MSRKWTPLALFFGAAAALVAIAALRSFPQPFNEAGFRAKMRRVAARTPRMTPVSREVELYGRNLAIPWSSYARAKEDPCTDAVSREAWSTPAHFKAVLTEIREAPSAEEKERLLGLLADWPHWQADPAFQREMAALCLSSPDPTIREAAAIAVERQPFQIEYTGWNQAPLEPAQVGALAAAALLSPEEGRSAGETARLFRILAHYRRIVPALEEVWWKLARERGKPSWLRDLAFTHCALPGPGTELDFARWMALFDDETDPVMRWHWFSKAWSRSGQIRWTGAQDPLARKRCLSAARRMLAEADRGDWRAFALFAVSQLEDGSLRAECLELQARDPAPEVRFRALAILHERYMDDEVMRAELTALRGDPEPEVRRGVVDRFEGDLRVHGPAGNFGRTHFLPPLREARIETTLAALEEAKTSDSSLQVRAWARHALERERHRYRPSRVPVSFLAAGAVLLVAIGATLGAWRLFAHGVVFRASVCRKTAAFAGILVVIGGSISWRYSALVSPRPFVESEFRARARALASGPKPPWPPAFHHSETESRAIMDAHRLYEGFAHEAWSSPERIRILISMIREVESPEDKTRLADLAGTGDHWNPDPGFVQEMADLFLETSDPAIRRIAGWGACGRPPSGIWQGWEESPLTPATVSRLEEYTFNPTGEVDRRNELRTLAKIMKPYRYLRPPLEDRWAAIAMDPGRPGWLRAFALEQIPLARYVPGPVHLYVVDTLCADPSPEVRAVGYDLAARHWPGNGPRFRSDVPGYDRFVSTLRKGASDAPSPGTRASCLWWLRHTSSVDLAELYLERLEHDPDERVREAALNGLVESPDPDGRRLRALLSVLDSDPGFRPRVLALSALKSLWKQQPAPEAEREIADAIRRASLEDPHPLIRKNATDMLAPATRPDPPGLTANFLGLTADRRDVACVALILALAVAALVLTRRAQ